jgi:hypothetical protein
MTTQPVGTRRPASLPGGVTGNAGQPVTWSSSRTLMTPFAIHAALTAASCTAQVRTWPVRAMMLSWASAFTSLPPGDRCSFPESRRDLACWPGEL